MADLCDADPVNRGFVSVPGVKDDITQIKSSMSFLRSRGSRPRGRGWSLAASATFAARRDFELLKLLSTADPSVIAVARRLGASFDVSSAEHVPADKGAAKRATPARGADSGAAASSATPRKRRKRVVALAVRT